MRRLRFILVAFLCLVLDATAAETVRYTMKDPGLLVLEHDTPLLRHLGQHRLLPLLGAG